ncbi:hypothetical protein B0H14DRAFT_2792037 [Mycena olivaceomarginata]|nr:hypothetical protein B0H14DRAFT_2792037 [Mycena olivaceomarginata]
MPVERSTPSYPVTQNQDDESLGELLYPDSDSETDTSAHVAPHQAIRPSHGRKRPDHHIPRPPNAFICFRSEYCERNKRLPDGEIVRNHRVVSIDAGHAWRALTAAGRKKYEYIAKVKKELHAQMYPNYSYSPSVPRPGVKMGSGKKRKASDDDCDYEEREPQSKRRRSQPRAPRLVVDAGSPALSLISGPLYGSSLAPAARSSAPSPEPPRSQTPELSPKSSSSYESPDLVLNTPAITFPQVVEDDDFVPTSAIPPLDLYAASSEKKDGRVGRYHRSSSLYDVGSQFFKADVPSQTRDLCMWYNNDGTYFEPTADAPLPQSSWDDYETYGLMPINYEEVQFSNPFELEMMAQFVHMDRFH